MPISDAIAPSPARVSPGGALLMIFAALWASGTLFHIASYNLWGRDRLLVFAAAGVLLVPRSIIALLILAVVQIASFWGASPFVPNHYLFAALVNGTILLSALVLAMRSRSLRIRPSALVETFAPAVRVGILFLYAFVVFHKLNTDFFDPSISCGTLFYGSQADRLAFLPTHSAMDVGAIVLALGFEAVIPLLLLGNTTRHLGIFVGAMFHYLLGMNPIDGFYNFSSLVLGLLVLFAAPTLVGQWMDGVGTRRFRVLTSFVLGCHAVAAIAGKYFTAALGTLDPFLVLWVVYGGAICALLFILKRRARRTDASAGVEHAFRLREWVTVVAPVLVVLNGLSPYLGLKTETAWSMFSNLRTEGDRSNHFLMPASVQVFDYQRELVRIRHSSNRYLQSLAQKELLVPLFEIYRRRPASVTWERNGVDVHLEGRAHETPVVFDKLLMFRPVDADGRQRCRH